jgi:2'-5' RNA ligase
MREIYNSLYENAVSKIKKGNILTDEYLNSLTDKRYGITLLLRPFGEVLDRTQLFINEIRKITPEQYYYQIEDIHLTVLSIISCYDGFMLNNIDTLKYFEIVKDCISNIDGFTIKFEGITASPSCVMIQGFPENSELEKLRKNLRKKFKNSDLEHSIDSRYELKTAHLTVIRFKKILSDMEQFLKKLDEFRGYDFGKCKIKEMDLVYNDWYMKSDKVKLLNKIKLDGDF